MSQSGLFAEHELPEHIYRYFDLKLDKDAFIRPSRDVVTEIYTRFLDKTLSNWRKPKSPGQPEPFALARMITLLRNIFSRYDIGYEFCSTDLTNPNRKRTTTFLNAILLYRIELDESIAVRQQCDAKRAEEHEEVQMFEREISKERVILEEEAYKRGQKPDVPQLREEIQAMEREFEYKKEGGAKLTEELARVKESISRSQQANQIKLMARQEIAQRIERVNQRKQVKLREADLREKLSIKERELAKLKKINSLRLVEEQTEEQKFVEQVKQIRQRSKNLETQSDALMEDIDNKCTELENQQKAYSREIEGFITQLKSEVGALRKRYEDSRAIVAKAKTRTANYRTRLNELVGVERPVVQVESSQNRTFIKSSQVH